MLSINVINIKQHSKMCQLCCHVGVYVLLVCHVHDCAKAVWWSGMRFCSNINLMWPPRTRPLYELGGRVCAVGRCFGPGATMPHCAKWFWSLLPSLLSLLLAIKHYYYWCCCWFLHATTATAVARLSHRNSVRPFVRPSVTQLDQSKMVQARITKS